MNRCTCPRVSPEKYKQLESMWVGDKEWNLLKLQDMYNAGNSLEDIADVVPFRNNKCTRSTRCCGVCTRRCHDRCIQDCLHRLSMWRMLVNSTPEEQRDHIPLAIRMIVTQDFETLYDLSWCVGEILSRSCNTALDKYMTEHDMITPENPYKIDYAAQPVTDPATGRKQVEPRTGRVQLIEWPQSGLCPYCVPGVMVYRRRSVRYDSAEHA